MCRFPFLFAGLLALSLLGSPIWADNGDPVYLPPDREVFSIPAKDESPPLPLSQALAALETPREDLFLAVAADKLMPVAESLPLEKGSTGGQAADAYGQIVRDFGNVMAIAPPTMTVLTTKPGEPAAFEDMPRHEALKLLLGSLSAVQWQALTSATGLGASDLFEGSQTAYFALLFPTGNLIAIPQFVPNGSAEMINLTGEDFRAVRLRLGRQMQIDIPLENQKNNSQQFSAAQSLGKIRYSVQEAGSRPPQDTTYGVTLRQTLPNYPKEADLDYHSAALDQTVSLAGVATVGDLIARIGQTVGLELYADRRLEKRTVTLLGPSTGNAKDLLRALAFCVAGTYRRVGPAYVLTNDRRGLAARQQIIGRFLQKAEMARSAAVMDAGDRVIKAQGVDTLPSLDGLGFSDAQLALAQQQPGYQSSPMRISLSLPFTQLTPAQQDFVIQQVQKRNQNAPASGRLTTNGQLQLSDTPVLQLLSPLVPEPMSLDDPNASSVYQPSARLQQRQWKEAIKATEEAAKKYPPPVSNQVILPSLISALVAYPRRAYIASPRTAAEVDAVIASMKAVGLNQLWLDVFSGGKSHLDKPKDGTPDILTEALARTKGTNIAVLPTLELLEWGLDASPEARELNFLGETSAQTQNWQQHFSDVNLGLSPKEVAQETPFSDVWVSPLVPVVQKTLTELVQRLAATPGVAVLVLRETLSPGYARWQFAGSSISEADLGYTPEMRLAFLRHAHVDPIDFRINPPLYGANVDLSLPEFPDADSISDVAADWGRFRVAANQEFLTHLLAAGKEAGGPQFRFLVRERSMQSSSNPTWYGLWTDPKAPLPGMIPEKPTSFFPGQLPWGRDTVQMAHSQSHVAVWELPLSFTELGIDESLLYYLMHLMQPGWDGFALNIHYASGSNPLAYLTK